MKQENTGFEGPAGVNPETAFKHFSKDLIKSVPELEAHFDRYLSYARFLETPEGVQVFCPTSFHQKRLEQFKSLIERALQKTVCRIGVEEASRPSPDSARSAAAALAVQQVRMSLLPDRAADDAFEAERNRRSKCVPQLVSSPAFEVVFKMAQQWSDGVNQGLRGQMLWIYGRSGSGKTYLAKQMHKWVGFHKRLHHVSVVDFFHEWREAINNKDLMAFMRKYRKDTDLLILENLDDLQGKPGTQQEILLSISSLMEKGASVMVCSTRSPAAFRGLLEPALFSRLFSGLAFEMPVPDREFKERLWRELLEQNGLSGWPIDVRVLEKIWSLPLDSTRKVHSFYINAIGRLSLKQTLTLVDVQELELVHAPRNADVQRAHMTAAETIEKVAKLCGVSLSALQGNNRRAEVTLARRFVCLSLSRFLGLTNACISQYLEKDPSTISHALSSIEQDIQTKRNIAQQWNWLCDELGFSQVLQ